MLNRLFFVLEQLLPVRWRWIAGHEGIKRYAANTGWMLAGQMFSLLVAFFVGAYVARYLGPSNFGLMNYAVSFAAIFSFMTGFGIDIVLKRELLEFPDKKDTLLGTGFWVKLVAGVLTLLLITVVSFQVNHDTLARTLIFVFSLTYIFSSFNIISTYFHTRVEARKVIQIQIVTTIVAALIKIWFMYSGLGVTWIIGVYVIESLLLAIGLIWLYRDNMKTLFHWNIDRTVAHTLAVGSWPLMLTYITIMVYTKIDQVFLRLWADTDAVGTYAVAARMSEIPYFLPTIICASLFPAIMHSRQTNRAAYANRMRHLYYLMILLALAVALPLFFGAHTIIVTLFGSAYVASVAVFKIYIWSVVPMFLVSALSQYLIAENRMRAYLAISAVGAVSNVLLNIFLIPRYGGVGAAVATVISYALIPLSFVLFRVGGDGLKRLGG